MNDFFSILRGYTRRQASTFADLIGETKEEDMMKRNLTEKELADYMIIKENNKERLYGISGNNKQNDTRVDKPFKKHISGIGEVQQMM